MIGKVAFDCLSISMMRVTLRQERLDNVGFIFDENHDVLGDIFPSHCGLHTTQVKSKLLERVR